MTALAGDRDAAWWQGECERMEIMRASCSHCRKLPDLPTRDDDYRDRSEVPDDAGKPAVFAARFTGRCAVCGTSIEPGDLITRLGTVGRYACQECGPWES